jgi:hypothetical protein
VTIKGRLKAIKETLGDLPVSALEKPAEVLRFKAAYRKGREVATVNRALSTLRASINWGRFQDPPYLTTTPFHRFGVSIKVKEETKRDRRIGGEEEQALLAACSEMNGAEHTMKLGFLLASCYFGGAIATELSHDALKANPFIPIVLLWIGAFVRDRFIFF